MKYNVWVEVLDDGQTIGCHKIAAIDRPSGLFRAEELGLSLAEGQSHCEGIQAAVMATQIA